MNLEKGKLYTFPSGRMMEGYGYIDEAGVFEGLFVGKTMNEDGTMDCYFLLDDRRKVRARLWLDSAYLGMDITPLGARVRLTFKKAGSGKCYLRGTAVNIE